MTQKRMRVFAGPNGSGKTTIINQQLLNHFNLGVYVNADDIEKYLKTTQTLDFSSYKIDTSTKKIQAFFKHSEFAPKKLNIPELWQQFSVVNNCLQLAESVAINSYIAADIAEFIRQSLLNAGLSFSYETVMSHAGKLSFMEKARIAGYRVYLYFVATEDPEININRVNIRVAQDGHPVKEEIIRNRYYKSLENLKAAVKLTDRAYIFDNSGKVGELLASITDGTDVELIDQESLPNWFVKYLVE